MPLYAEEETGVGVLKWFVMYSLSLPSLMSWPAYSEKLSFFKGFEKRKQEKGTQPISSKTQIVIVE